MILFIMGSLSAMAIVFLITICIHAIKVERTIIDLVETTEVSVKKFYSEGGG